MTDPEYSTKDRPGTAPVELLVCRTCRGGLSDGSAPSAEPEDPRPGEKLHAALAAAVLPPGVRVTPVECLSNCDSGCSIVLRGGPDRWTYVYGNLDHSAHLEIILEGVARYRDTTDGLVPWRQRPVHFRKNCIARIPPSEVINA